MTKPLSILKVIPFLCFVAGMAINNMQDSISSQWRMIISLVLLAISIVSVVVYRLTAPKSKNLNKQIVILAAFLLLTVVLYFYFLFEQ
jgi:hypothetical protein